MQQIKLRYTVTFEFPYISYSKNLFVFVKFNLTGQPVLYLATQGRVARVTQKLQRFASRWGIVRRLLGPFRPGMKRRPSGVCYQQPNPHSRVKKPCPRYGRSERFELTSNVRRLAPKERRNDSERRRRAQGRSRPPDSKMAPAAASRCQDGGAGSRLRSQTIFTQSSFG